MSNVDTDRDPFEADDAPRGITESQLTHLADLYDDNDWRRAVQELRIIKRTIDPDPETDDGSTDTVTTPNGITVTGDAPQVHTEGVKEPDAPAPETPREPPEPPRIDGQAGEQVEGDGASEPDRVPPPPPVSH